MDALRWQFEVNVLGQIAVTQAMLPLLRKAPGRIVTIGSVGSWITMPLGGPLCASKHAIRSLNDALRMELRPWRIDAVLIEPGSIKTAAVDKVEASIAPTLEAMEPRGRQLYEEAFTTMASRALARERKGSNPGVVAKAVHHALTARRPRTRYPVGKDSRLLSTLARVLPQRALDDLRRRALGLTQLLGETR